MNNKFSPTLKHLIKFSGTKLSALANYIGYDISYISKWCKGTNQPSRKRISHINSRIAEFITDEIIQQDTVYPFLSEFEINRTEKLPTETIRPFLCNEINNILNNAYFSQETPDEPSISTDDVTRAIIGRTRIHNFFVSDLVSLLQNAPEPINFFITADIFTLIRTHFFAFLREISKKKQININIGCAKKSLSLNQAVAVRSLYKFLNKYINIRFTIYDNTPFANSNIIVAENIFYLQYSLNQDDLFDISTFSTDKQNVADVFRRTWNKFMNSNIFLEAKTDLEIIKFRAFFYLSEELILFCAKGFEFFLPEKAFQKLLANADPQFYPRDILQTVKNLQITWEEQFIKSHMVFILPEANIMNYIENGRLTYGEINYCTTAEEREEQLKILLAAMEHNPNIELNLLAQHQLQNRDDYYKLSYYSNNKTAYLKKDKDFLNDDDKNIYLLKDPLFIQAFDNYFYELTATSLCKKISCKELAKLYEINKPLLYRLFK